jgi:hypothetical protein
VVRTDDPPLDVSAMTRLVLDAEGRLLSFVAVPPQLDDSAGPWPEPDWQPFLREAGLDPAALTSGATLAAPVDSDHKATWQASPARTCRPRAAAYSGPPGVVRGQPPWTRPERMQAAGPARAPGGRGEPVCWLACRWAAHCRRNIGRPGRPRGRPSRPPWCSRRTAWRGSPGRPTSFGQELFVLVKVFAYPSFWALQVWLLYMALEPYARRRWPHVLIAWQRLWAGNGHDPLVGRDVLAGCVTGVGLFALYHLLHLVPAWLGLAPSAPDTNLNGPTLTELRHVAFRLLVNVYGAVLYGLTFLFILVLLRMLAQRPRGRARLVRSSRVRCATTAPSCCCRVLCVRSCCW